jgi:predicted transcriptional regulator
LKAAVDRYLDGPQIKEILQRRDRMKEEIDEMVAERGEANVFFP